MGDARHHGGGKEDGSKGFLHLGAISTSSSNSKGGAQGLDSLDWYGLCGPECRGGGEDVITH